MDFSKVMEGLNFCSDGHNCKFCPYYHSGSTGCVSKLASDAYKLLAEKSNEPRNTLNKLLSKLECHSNYHGDTIVSAIRVLKEGKELPKGQFNPVPSKTETEYEPKVFKDEDFEEPTYYCGKCGVEVMADYDNYCSSCGAKIKWVEDGDYEVVNKKSYSKSKSAEPADNPSKDVEYSKDRSNNKDSESRYSKNFYDFCDKEMEDLYFDIHRACVNRCCDSIVKEISSFLKGFKNPYSDSKSTDEIDKSSKNSRNESASWKLEIEDVMNLKPGSDIWIESESLDGTFQVHAATVECVEQKELICVSESRRYLFHDYNLRDGYWAWRVWTERPTEDDVLNTSWSCSD